MIEDNIYRWTENYMNVWMRAWEEASVAAVERVVALFAPDGVDRELIHSDIEWDVPEGYPAGGKYYGSRAVFEDYLPKLSAHFDSWNAKADQLLDAGDAIVGLGHYYGRVKGSEQEFAIPFAHIWWVCDGKIIKTQGYADTLTLHRYIKGLVE